VRCARATPLPGRPISLPRSTLKPARRMNLKGKPISWLSVSLWEMCRCWKGPISLQNMNVLTVLRGDNACRSGCSLIISAGTIFTAQSNCQSPNSIGRTGYEHFAHPWREGARAALSFSVRGKSCDCPRNWDNVHLEGVQVCWTHDARPSSRAK